MREILNTELLNELFKHNNYTTYFVENGLPISKKVEDKVKKLYQNDLDNKKFTSHYSLSRRGLDFFYQFWTDEDIGKKIITSGFVVPPRLDIKSTKELIADVFDKDKRIKTAHFYVPIKSKLYRQLLELGATNNGSHLFGLVQDGLKYLSQYEYSKSIQITDFKKSDLEEAIELEYFAQKLSETTRCGTLPRKEIRCFFNSLLKRKRKVILAKEEGKIVGIIAPSINDFSVGHIMTISVHPDEQKRGISKLLYFEAMKFLKKEKVKMYSGVSTTTEVLGLSKRMKRKARYAYLEIVRK